jgi:hypothetical protein
MPSLFSSLLGDRRRAFESSAEDAQKLAALRDTFAQAGITGGAGQTTKLPQFSGNAFEGKGLGAGLPAAFGAPSRGAAYEPPSPPPQFEPMPSGQISRPGGDSGEDKSLDEQVAAFKKQFGPKQEDPTSDIDAKIARIEAQYRAEMAARGATPRPGGRAMTPLEGPDTGDINPNAPGAPPTPTRAAFIAEYLPHALRVSKATGLDPRLVLAQAAHETGWGQHAPNNNFFGIKGPGPAQQTWEDGPNGPYQTTASFRAYKSPGESFDDYGRLLQNNSIYAPVLSAETLSGQIAAMGKSGYATDRNYTKRLTDAAAQIQIPEAPPVDGTTALRRGGYFNMIRSKR